MTLRWFISLMLSFLLHIVFLYGMYFRQSQQTAPVVPMEVTLAPPEFHDLQEDEALETQAEADQLASDLQAVPDDNLNFRPVTENENNLEQDTSEPQPEDSSEDEFEPVENIEPIAEKAEDIAAAETEELSADTTSIPQETPRTPAEYKADIQDYRQQLITEFQVNWHKIPELNTKIPHPSMVADIDSYFGITIIAYGFVNNRPSPPFLIFDVSTQTYTKTDQFDFSRFSNRIKDRSFDPVCQKALKKARQEFGLNSFMKIIGLVPTETDRYFAAKQYQAVQSARIPLEQVALTSGHYESNKSGEFSLIIDTITTVDGQTIQIHDKERQYSQRIE